MNDPIRIQIKLIPKAAKNEISGWEINASGEKTLKASVTAPPDKGKANKALINLLAKTWKTPKTNIHIIKGETSRLKTIEIKTPNNYTCDLVLDKN